MAVSSPRGLSARDTRILGITSMGPGDALSFHERTGFHYPLLLDADGSVARAYAITQCPTLWFVDAHGYARAKLAPGSKTAVSGGQLSEWLSSVSGGQGVRASRQDQEQP